MEYVGIEDNMQIAQLFHLTKHSITSEETIMNLGFNEEEYTYFEPKLYKEIKAVEDLTSLYEGLIAINLDTVKHNRSIYTFWDFLGDVGGLLGIL